MSVSEWYFSKTLLQWDMNCVHCSEYRSVRSLEVQNVLNLSEIGGK